MPLKGHKRPPVLRVLMLTAASYSKLMVAFSVTTWSAKIPVMGAASVFSVKGDEVVRKIP